LVQIGFRLERQKLLILPNQLTLPSRNACLLGISAGLGRFAEFFSLGISE
jgi:hypothetical protein